MERLEVSQYRAWSELVCFLIAVDEVSLADVSASSETNTSQGAKTYKHAQCWYKGDNLENAPEGEEDVSEHRLE